MAYMSAAAVASSGSVSGHPKSTTIASTSLSCLAHGSVNQILSHGNRSFAWIIGGQENTIAGFEMVDWKNAAENWTGVKSDKFFGDGERHTSLDRSAARGSQRIWTVNSWDLGTDYKDVQSFSPYASVRGAVGLLGLGSRDTPVVFNAEELIPVTGPWFPFNRAEPSGRWIDLLNGLNPKDGNTASEWHKEPGQLIAEPQPDRRV